MTVWRHLRRRTYRRFKFWNVGMSAVLNFFLTHDLLLSPIISIMQPRRKQRRKRPIGHVDHGHSYIKHVSVMSFTYNTRQTSVVTHNASASSHNNRSRWSVVTEGAVISTVCRRLKAAGLWFNKTTGLTVSGFLCDAVINVYSKTYNDIQHTCLSKSPVLKDFHFCSVTMLHQ